MLPECRDPQNVAENPAGHKQQNLPATLHIGTTLLNQLHIF